MTTITSPALSDQRAASSEWAVETHGLTKRFGPNVAVNGVELLVPRRVVGVTTTHLTPGGLPVLGGGGGGPGGGAGNPGLVPETTAVAVCVIVAWLVVWSVLGAWRMMTRDA